MKSKIEPYEPEPHPPWRAGVGWAIATFLGWATGLGIGFLQVSLLNVVLQAVMPASTAVWNALYAAGWIIGFVIAGYIAGAIQWQFSLKGYVDQKRWRWVGAATGFGLIVFMLISNSEFLATYTCEYTYEDYESFTHVCTLTSNWQIMVILKSLLMGACLGTAQWFGLKQAGVPRAFIWVVMWVGITFVMVWQSTQGNVHDTAFLFFDFESVFDGLVWLVVLAAGIPGVVLALLLAQSTEKRKRKPKES